MEAAPNSDKESKQDEFLTFKTLSTLAGSVTATWLICNTVSSLFPPNYLTYYQWRYIALAFSEAISLYLAYRSSRKGPDKWVLGFLNGLMIFVNVSGLNAISTGTKLFQGPDETTSFPDSIKVSKKSNLLPFTKELSWWPDVELIDKIAQQDSIIANTTQVVYVDSSSIVNYKFTDTKTIPIYGNRLNISGVGILPFVFEDINYKGKSYTLKLYGVSIPLKLQPDSCGVRITLLDFRDNNSLEDDSLTVCEYGRQSNKDGTKTIEYRLYDLVTKKFEIPLYLTLDIVRPKTIKLSIGSYKKTYILKYFRFREEFGIGYSTTTLVPVR